MKHETDIVMDPLSQSSRRDLLERVRQLENLVSHNFGSITDTIPQNDRKFLTQNASPSVVEISCWIKESYLVGEAKRDAAMGLLSTSYATGFIIGSNDVSTLILSCAHYVLPLFPTATKTRMETIQSQAVISVKFFEDESKVSELLYLDFSRDLSILRVRGVVRKSFLRFFEEEDVLEDRLIGMPIFTISHPIINGEIHPYTFSQGKACRSCEPVPRNLLASDTHCLMYVIPTVLGSSGAPILNARGEVVAVHSSSSDAFYFGIGLKTIKKALIKLFNLHSADHESVSANRVLELGLRRR